MIMAGSAGDTLVMASNSPIRLDLAEIRRRMERPEVARDLARIGVRDLPALLAHYRAGGESLRERVGAGPLNTDDNALVEFAAARTLYRTHHDDTEETLFHASSSPLDRADISGLTPAEAAMLPVAMARAWLDADLPERAKEALKRGAGGRDLQPTLDAQMAAARGDLLERLGDGEGARAAWEAALLADPGSLEGGSLGRALQKEPETLPRAVSLLSRVAKAHPRDARVRLELGRALAASQRHDEAIVALNEAAGLDPMPETEPFIHMEWGRACFATGDPDCAIREISRYFREWREVPKPAQLSVDAALDLGQALLMKGDKVRAMEQFRVAAELGGTLANWHRGQSDEALRIDEGELAEYHLRKAIEWNALDARAYHNLGAILTNQGRWEEALETWAALLERRPDDARALRGLIAAMHQLGREEQMVPHLEHLIQVEEDPERLMALQLSLDRLRAGEPISQAPSPDTD
jgi:tetratricopeptide (TPR) repeat protein